MPEGLYWARLSNLHHVWTVVRRRGNQWLYNGREVSAENLLTIGQTVTGPQ